MILFQSVGVIIKISFQGSLEPKKKPFTFKGKCEVHKRERYA